MASRFVDGGPDGRVCSWKGVADYTTGGAVCGIAGVRNLDGAPVSRELLMGMAAQLFHRGADDSGVWAEGSCGLAHTWSSIIDIAASRQPMVGADGHAHLVFNGEILNYREPRGVVLSVPHAW